MGLSPCGGHQPAAAASASSPAHASFDHVASSSAYPGAPGRIGCWPSRSARVPLYRWDEVGSEQSTSASLVGNLLHQGADDTEPYEWA